MAYVYHGVPKEMRGDTLIPLNRMPQLFPDLYEEYTKKYLGREEVTRRTIPLLNCLWNDVVQFLPLHPRVVFELQKELGFIPKVPAYSFYEINIDAFNPTTTVIYFKSKAGEENAEVKWLQDVQLSDIQEIPRATKDYYESIISTGERPFNYQFIPHILSSEPIDISNARIITL